MALRSSSLSRRWRFAPIKPPCDPAAIPKIASLLTCPPGTPVEVRFRLSDGSDCFKVSATINGKDVLGYVPGSALTGLERYEQERASAASVDTLRALNPLVTETKEAIALTGDPALDRAQQLLDANQPAQALDQMQIALQRHPRDPGVLVIAGLAAYRADQLEPRSIIGSRPWTSPPMSASQASLRAREARSRRRQKRRQCTASTSRSL